MNYELELTATQPPRRRLTPTAEQLSYTKDLLEVFVLLLALPYLLHELFSGRARDLSKRMAGHKALT